MSVPHQTCQIIDEHFCHCAKGRGIPSLPFSRSNFVILGVRCDDEGET
jgi:hypothetical protein